jgi:DNA-binding transcriptional LysR family regulator
VVSSTARTVEEYLAALEEATATSLFDRCRHGIALTKAAEDLLPVVEEIEQAMLRFTNAAEGLEREDAGTVRVTCPADVAEVVVVPFLRQLFTQHPALRIELTPGGSRAGSHAARGRCRAPDGAAHAR